MIDRHQIDVLLQERDRARQAKDWASSDAIRHKLKALGVEVEDTPKGQRATGGTLADLHACEYRCADLEGQLRTLEITLKIMRVREEADAAKIRELVRENLSLKFGG